VSAAEEIKEEAEIIELAHKQLDSKMKDFSELLSDIESLNDKKKRLWLEIYGNAITDRQNSYAMFVKLVNIAQDKSTEHAVHGKTMSSYLERMSRANDQLLKLAELIAKAEDVTESVNPDVLFDNIKNGLDKKRK
jgi:hypothetical protein